MTYIVCVGNYSRVSHNNNIDDTKTRIEKTNSYKAGLGKLMHFGVDKNSFFEVFIPRQ